MKEKYVVEQLSWFYYNEVNLNRKYINFSKVLKV